MKIIHCADLHLDSRLTANLSKEQARERRMELLKTFERMVDYASRHEVKAVIIAGDLFDTKNVSATARNSVIGKITGNPGIDFYYLKGNHDADSFLNALPVIPDNLKMFEHSWRSYVANPQQGGAIVITGVELSEDNADTVCHSLVLDNSKFNIVVLHGQDSRYGMKNKTEVINLRALQNKGIDYLALGHVHTYKKEALDKRGIYCYCGCLEGRGFDETGECGFVLLDIDDSGKYCESEFVPFAGRNLYKLDIDITGCMTSKEITEKTERELDEAGYAGKSLVKIVLNGRVDVECEKNLDYLKKQLENRFYFLKIYDETKLAVDYHAFALDESLKGEFVRIVNAADGLDDDTKAEIIHCGIQALAGEEIE